MNKDIWKQELKELLQDHFKSEPHLTHAHWFGPEEGSDEVRLIEVNPEGPSSGRLFVMTFKATQNVPFKLHIAEVHPDVWSAIEAGDISLPQGWPTKPLRTFGSEDLILDDEFISPPE